LRNYFTDIFNNLTVNVHLFAHQGENDTYYLIFHFEAHGKINLNILYLLLFLTKLQ